MNWDRMHLQAGKLSGRGGLQASRRSLRGVAGGSSCVHLALGGIHGHRLRRGPISIVWNAASVTLESNGVTPVTMALLESEKNTNPAAPPGLYQVAHKRAASRLVSARKQSVP